VNPVLTEAMINAGRTFLEKLDRQRISINDAFWVLAQDAISWRLVFATPEVRIQGPRSVYRKLQKILPTLSVPDLTLSDLSVIDTKESLVQLLRTALRTGPGISGIRFSNNTINGVFIPDVYIYRLS